jgi:hypothetical protein
MGEMSLTFLAAIAALYLTMCFGLYVSMGFKVSVNALKVVLKLKKGYIKYIVTYWHSDIVIKKN